MLRFALLLRFVTLVPALGAAFGAILMFWLGGVKLAGVMSFVLLPKETGAQSVIIAVMEATDAFLFGLVLIVFAYGITFGFAFDLPRAAREKLPPWMRVEGISEIKNTLIQIVLVYLIVDFATDIAEVETRVSWDMLVKPVSIVLIAGALRLLGNTRSEDHTLAEVGFSRASSPNQQ
ncbi:MAG: YqhA family protein [Burkholderiales bacterium]